MEEKLREIVARIGEIPKDFSAGAHLRDELNIDSFRAVEIVFEIERAFKITVPGQRYGEVETFNDMLKLVTSLGFSAVLSSSKSPKSVSSVSPMGACIDTGCWAIRMMFRTRSTGSSSASASSSGVASRPNSCINCF